MIAPFAFKVKVTPRMRRLLAGGLTALVLLGPVRWHLVTLARVVTARMAFPMDLEWMDGGALYHAYRWMHGLPLYTSPDRWVPYPYPPMHFAALAALGRLFGLDYAVGRTLALGGLAVCLALLAIEIARASGSKAFAGIGMALSVASLGAAFPLLGGTLDNIRPDSLALIFVVAAAFLVPDGPVRWGRAAAIALALSLALYSKQTSAFFVAWILAYLAWRDRRSAAKVALLTLGLCGAALAALQAETGGWFVTWLLNTRHHPMRLSQLDGARGLVAFLPLLVPLAVLLPGEGRPRVWLWAGMFGAALLGGVLALLKVGGWLNNLIAPVTLAGPVTCLAASRARARRGALQLAAVVLAGAMLWALEYDPRELSPTDEQKEEARRANELVRGLDGCVAIPIYPFLAIRNGHDCPEVSSQAYVDAKLAGMPVDQARGVAETGARWVVLTGAFGEVSPPGYVVDRELPIAIGDLRYYEFPEGPRKTLVFRRVE